MKTYSITLSDIIEELIEEKVSKLNDNCILLITLKIDAVKERMDIAVKKTATGEVLIAWNECSVITEKTPSIYTLHGTYPIDGWKNTGLSFTESVSGVITKHDCIKVQHSILKDQTLLITW